MMREQQDDKQPDRSAAKAMVRESWQQRRRQQQVLGETKVSSKKPTAPCVCPFVSTTWKQLWSQVLEKNKSEVATGSQAEGSKNEQQDQTNEIDRIGDPTAIKSNRATYFPSVISIFQQHALAQHVHESRDRLAVLSGDWETAMQSMIRKRSRVVWLVDVASIVRNAVAWSHRWESHVHGVYDGPKDPLILDCMRNHRIVCRGLHIDSPNPGKPDSILREWDVSVPLIVDGAEEVDRVRATIRRVRGRRKQPMVEPLFILRLDSKLQLDDWKNIYDTTCAAMVNRLVGVSMDAEDNNTFVVKLEALLAQIELNQEVSRLQLHLTGSFIPERLVRSLDSHDFYLDADLSAGALCTRIIGVREQENRRHYYIDDGCYGSLTQQADPVPLLLANTDPDGAPQRKMISTVWGPTCDGLDRVCEAIELPVLQRDDWLVFPSASGQSQDSTGFNGFDPPDTAYCVVGYFDGKKHSPNS